MKNGIRLGQSVIAGVVAERAFVAQRLARVNVAFDVDDGLPADLSAGALAKAEASGRQALDKTVSNSGKCFQGSVNSVKETQARENLREMIRRFGPGESRRLVENAPC